MSICGTLAEGFSIDCANPIVAGVEDSFRIFNYDDIQEGTVTNDGTNDLGIKAIVLPSGKTGFDVQTFRNNIVPISTYVDVNGVPRSSHSFQFTVSDDDVDAQRFIDTLSKGRFVVSYFTRSKQVKVMGLKSGLEVSSIERNQVEGNAFATIILSSREGQEEPQPPSNFLGSATTYDYASAKAEMEAL